MSVTHLGFYNTSSTRTHVRFQFSTHAAAGGNVAPNSAFEAADIRIYRAADGAAFSATQRSSANGVTMTSPFDSLTGYHDVDIDLTDNTDAGFYAAGYTYLAVLAPDETIDSQTITGIPLAYWEIGKPQTDVRQFGGSDGTFSSGRPEVNVSHLAGSAIDQSGGLINANVKQISADATAADNAEAFFDGTGYAGTGNVIPTVTTLTNDPSGVTTLLSRVPSGIFTGMTSLAQWLGLIAGKQTGNSTARTEIRATGGGSGTYDETTDSQEALRDRGDSAWTTATGFSTHSASDVWAVATRTLTAFDSSFKTGYALSSAGVQAIWDALTSALTTVGSIGKLLVDNINATIGSRSSHTAANVRTEMDSNSTQLAAIVADTNELQTDLANGGRLDLLIDAILADTGTDGVVISAATANAIADAMLDRAAGVETNRTPRQALRLILAALVGKLSGAATSTVTIRDTNDGVNRVVATCDSDGNRSAVTLDAS